MSEKQVLFNAEMTKAILDGRKVQTRRVIKQDIEIYGGHETDSSSSDDVGWCFLVDDIEDSFLTDVLIKKYSKYQTGDILWVREPAKVIEYTPPGNYGGGLCEETARIKYLADGYETFWDDFPEDAKSWLWECKGVPGGCVKEMARIFLRVADVRVERLQDMPYDDIFKEGLGDKRDYCDDCGGLDYCNNFNNNTICGMVETPAQWWVNLWNKTAPKGYRWEDNPYVFVYEFEVIKEL